MHPEDVRIQEGLKAADTDADDIFNIVRAALRLEAAMYRNEDTKEQLFTLRKALEGIWGHELPEPPHKIQS